MVVSPDEMWDKLKEENEQEGRDWSIVTPAVKEAVMKNVRRRMTPQPLKIRADLEMTCFTYGGVEHIKVSCFRWASHRLPFTSPVSLKHSVLGGHYCMQYVEMFDILSWSCSSMSLCACEDHCMYASRICLGKTVVLLS